MLLIFPVCIQVVLFWVHLSFHFFLIFLDWPLDHHVMSFLISVNSVYFGVHFSDVSMIPNLYFDFFVHGVSFFIPSLSACACLWVWSESPIAAYIWVLFLYQFIYYVFKCCFCCSVPKSCLPSTAVCKAFLFFTITQSLFKLMSTESMMASNHLILSYPCLLLPSVFPSIMVFSSELALRINWPKYWSFSFSINEYSGLISFRIDWFDLLAVQRTLKSLSNTIVRKHQFFSTHPSSQPNSHIHTWPQEKP